MLMALDAARRRAGGSSKLSSSGVPVRAILLGHGVRLRLGGHGLHLARHVFAFLVNSYGTVAIFVYVLIALAELRLRAASRRRARND